MAPKSSRTRRPASRKRGPATEAVHAGETVHGLNAPVVSPIVQSATFTFKNVEEMKRWVEGKTQADIYTRYGNPTLRVAEAKLAALEGAEAAMVTASGMAAISSAILAVVGSGEEIIATRSLYGGTYRMMRDLFPRFGIKVHFVDLDLKGAERAITRKTRLLYTETPTNPTLRLVDLEQAAAFARKHRLYCFVDNTFATPIFQKPLTLGYDLVLHSATKYLSGHSDVIAGAVAGSREMVRKVHSIVIALGGSLDPGAGYLLARGIKTIEPRVLKQAANAQAIAEYLEARPKVERVHYPGLASHPDHELARRQMSGFSAMMAFDVKGGLAAMRRTLERLRIFLLAASLGGVDSLACPPIYTSHYGLSGDELKRAGVSEGTIRLSIGIEDPHDLIADLDQALR